jgi:superfamily II DNA or RNA helicase
MIPLRPYQDLALRHIQQRLHQGEHRLSISLPTGTGKSVILAAFAAHAVEQGRVLVLAHLQDLVVQLAGELSRQGLEVGRLIRDSRYFGHLLRSKSATGQVNHRIYKRTSLRSSVK